MELPRTLLIRVAWLGTLAAIIAILLAVGIIISGWTQFARTLPALDPWHQQSPASEFNARHEEEIRDFNDYLAREEKVFEELDASIEGSWNGRQSGKFSRFNPESVSHPGHGGSRNWNRSMIREHPEPRGGVLMIHGLSDSPYSFRALSDRLYREGHTVMLLRVPGHGTCPAALAEVDWRDWAAAVRVAARDLRKRLPGNLPLIVAGYSNGGALTVNYAVESIEDAALPVPDALVLISPMIGITPLAEITRFHQAIAAISGEARAHWSSVNAEIDPYKYTSWPMNASVQAFKMTRRVDAGLANLAAAGRMDEFPPVLAHVSAIDATVKISNLIDGLFQRLDGTGSHLVVYDVNRHAWMESLIKDDYEKAFRSLAGKRQLRYDLSFITNRRSGTRELVEIRSGNPDPNGRVLDLKWPEHLFSLAHAALPFPPDDPYYGANADGGSPLPLGSLSLRGEAGVLRVSDGQIVRLRHNPFYHDMEDRIVTWLAGR